MPMQIRAALVPKRDVSFLETFLYDFFFATFFLFSAESDNKYTICAIKPRVHKGT
jgi:hypothetical protein